MPLSEVRVHKANFWFISKEPIGGGDWGVIADSAVNVNSVLVGLLCHFVYTITINTKSNDQRIMNCNEGSKVMINVLLT